MYARIQRSALALILALSYVAGTAAWAEEAKPVRLKTFAKSERRLTKGVKGVEYSKKTYKYSRATKVRLKEDQSLVLTAWSSAFRPTITVRPSGSRRILTRGTYDPVRKHEGTDWYVTQLQFVPQDRGVFVVTISTKGIDQGTYFTEGAIWGYEKPKKPAAVDPDAPSTAEASAQGFKYEPYKPFQSKYKHYVGGAYKRGGKFAAEVGVHWLEGGDTGKTLGLPTDPKSGYGNVERRDGNVFYFEPEGYTRKGQKVISSYKIMIFHPERELSVMIRVQAPHAASIPAFVKKGQALYAKYESKARPQP